MNSYQQMLLLCEKALGSLLLDVCISDYAEKSREYGKLVSFEIKN